jgi:hypothetical protein
MSDNFIKLTIHQYSALSTVPHSLFINDSGLFFVMIGHRVRAAHIIASFSKPEMEPHGAGEEYYRDVILGPCFVIGTNVSPLTKPVTYQKEGVT